MTDIQAFIIQASEEIAKESGFVANDKSDSDSWVKSNFAAILKRAMELNAQSATKGAKSEELKKVLAVKVWSKVKANQANQAYAKILG